MSIPDATGCPHCIMGAAEHHPSCPSYPERIVAAAIKVIGVEVPGYDRYEVVLSVPQPGRHHHVAWWASAHNASCREQGFLTNRGRYVDRKEAAVIAEAAGQRLRVTGSKETLYSEDLW